MLKYNYLEYNIESLKNKIIILFGASSCGIRVKDALARFNINIAYFCDNDINKHGKYIDGIKIMDIEELKSAFKSNYMKIIIIISSQYSDEIEEQLMDFNIKNNVCTYKGIMRILKTLYFRYNRENMVKYNNLSLIKSDLQIYFFLLYALQREYLYNEVIYLVYSRPKTGGVSLINTLKDKYNKNVIFDRGIFFKHKDMKILGEHYRESIYNVRNDIKIISIVREPLSCNISILFHYYEFIYDEIIPYSDCENLQTLFNRIFIYNNISEQNYDQPFLEARFKSLNFIDYKEWFDTELKVNLGIDVFKFQFNKNAGYTIIKQEGRGELLILKLEKIKELNSVIGEFTDIENFELDLYNDASSKDYSKAYKDFKENFKVPKWYIDKLYNSKYMQHFYSDKEIAVFREKWKRNIVN